MVVNDSAVLCSAKGGPARFAAGGPCSSRPVIGSGRISTKRRADGYGPPCGENDRRRPVDQRTPQLHPDCSGTEQLPHDKTPRCLNAAGALSRRVSQFIMICTSGQFRKASLSMVTLPLGAGIVTLTRSVQLLKASFSIRVIVAGSVMYVRLSQRKNA